MANELAPVDLVRLGRDEAEVADGFWRKLRRHADKVPFIEEAVAAWYCATDRSTPLRVKAVLMGALAYFVLPGDLIPDILPVLGFTDDAAVLLAALRAIGGAIHDDHRDRARAAIARLAG
ncbi:MAG: YkvA family protein [Dongiaceae bacterium]